MNFKEIYKLLLITTILFLGALTLQAKHDENNSIDGGAAPSKNVLHETHNSPKSEKNVIKEEESFVVSSHDLNAFNFDEEDDEEID